MSVFTKVAINKVRHNTFDLSHSRKFSGSMGQLIPCFLAEAVPNDSFNISTSQLVRFAPMVAPVMHRFSAYIHFFFVPNRIIWNEWEDFINGGEDGEQTPAFPFLNMDDITGIDTEGSLADYLGLPVGQDLTTTESPVSCLPFAAYQRVWYEFYRDQNLILGWDNISESVASGDNLPIEAFLTHLQQRAWQHDYFTSALPWTQRGPEATLPLGLQADLVYDNTLGNTTVNRNDTGLPAANVSNFGTDVAGDFQDNITGTPEPHDVVVTENTYVDLSTATASSINDLRRAFRLQEWLELNARGGARYNETIKVHFGISPGDSRLQRPEFLGGSATPIVISEVLQTSSTSTEPTPQGNMAGHGVSIGGKNITRYKCREHGYIIGIMSLMPKSAYQQGLAKHWFKFDKFDYYWRTFANIGEQPVLNKEVYVDTSDGADDNIFGYIPRYAEYKYINDTVHGEFRSTLDFWHGGRIFANRPVLNSTFVQCFPAELDRIFAVANEEQFYCQMHHRVKARRPMPYFGTPTI